MKITISEITYSVEVDEEKFSALLEYEDIWNGGLKTSEMCLDGQLRNIGCNKADYDGHYANYIWFTVSVEDDTEEFRNQIIETINVRLKESVDWVKGIDT